jgi:hypothetical protein
MVPLAGWLAGLAWIATCHALRASVPFLARTEETTSTESSDEHSATCSFLLFCRMQPCFLSIAILQVVHTFSTMVRSHHLVATIFALAVSVLPVSAFSPTANLGTKLSASSTQLYDGNGTGGWGIGGSRVMVPEEFVRGDRRYFDGYQMSEQGDFRRQLANDQESLRSSELEELLGVAKIAGIKVKNPNERLNKFEEVIFDDDDDELDLSV